MERTNMSRREAIRGYARPRCRINCYRRIQFGRGTWSLVGRSFVDTVGRAKRFFRSSRSFGSCNCINGQTHGCVVGVNVSIGYRVRVKKRGWQKRERERESKENNLKKNIRAITPGRGTRQNVEIKTIGSFPYPLLSSFTVVNKKQQRVITARSRFHSARKRIMGV